MEERMCLIALRRNQGEALHEKYFNQALTRNKDGIGLMYVNNDRVVTRKLGSDATWKDKESFYTEFANAPAPALVHLRFGTAGNRADQDNAHPFQILSKDKDGVDLWMMHNGHMHIAEIDSTKSDSWHFANLYIKPLVKGNPYVLTNPYVQQLIKRAIGSNRLVFLYGCGTYVIIADDAATDKIEYGGAWLSNENYFIKSYTPYSQQACNNNQTTEAPVQENKASHPDIEDSIDESNINEGIDEDDENEEVEDLIELPDDVQEQIELLKTMTDDDLYNFTDYQPDDAARLLQNLRDHFCIDDMVANKVASK